ncbi:MAG: hypothetical protein HEQ17_04795 [Limnohabitans sp.]|jgi:hypothetical protein|uniref:hypothetical protein n=1 Tax=Limnohabitans sp. TaxID=1907725 RepID=UPI0025E618E9|nr:hypothetical protein [Limnohabitans sp.]MCO4088284.1 hypothetical protein [Limnohabitans sp.]
MQTTGLLSNQAKREARALQQCPPLPHETRSHIPTADAAHHLIRRPQTLRAWACLENGPLRPIRINGRLAWPVAEIKALMGVA